MSNNKVVLVVKRGCKACRYIVRMLQIHNLLDKVDIITVEEALKEGYKVEATPAVIVDKTVDYISGDLYGFIKLLLYLIHR